jgi:hypothetical protein
MLTYLYLIFFELGVMVLRIGPYINFIYNMPLLSLYVNVHTLDVKLILYYGQGNLL